MFHLLFICLWNFRSIPRLKMVEMMYEKLRVYYKTVRTLERLMGQITINETLETILNLRATLMQEYLSSSSLTAIIMRSQIMPPKLIEQMALWKKSSLRKSWSRPSHYHRLMRLQTWALKNGAHHFEAECYSVPRVYFGKKVHSLNFCALKITKKCLILYFHKSIVCNVTDNFGWTSFMKVCI